MKPKKTQSSLSAVRDNCSINYTSFQKVQMNLLDLPPFGIDYNQISTPLCFLMEVQTLQLNFKTSSIIQFSLKNTWGFICVSLVIWYATSFYGVMVNILDSESRGSEFSSWWNLFLEEETWSVIFINSDHETSINGINGLPVHASAVSGHVSLHLQ